MIIKAGIFLVLVSLCVPVISSAQSTGSTASSIESLNLQDIADESIVVLSKEETGLAGYLNVKYAFVDSVCGGGVQLVHYSGPAFDLNDPIMLKNELRQCSGHTYDSGGDD